MTDPKQSHQTHPATGMTSPLLPHQNAHILDVSKAKNSSPSSYQSPQSKIRESPNLGYTVPIQKSPSAISVSIAIGDVFNSNMTHARLPSIDLLRGFIMVVAAWQHTLKAFASNADTTNDLNESWYGPLQMYGGNFFSFFASTISHICGPGFSYLMGIGMVLFTLSRSQKGWSSWKILFFFQLRGIVLIGTGFVIRSAFLIGMINPTPTFVDWTTDNAWKIFIGYQGWAITSLGLQMMVSSIFLTAAYRLATRSLVSHFGCKNPIPSFLDFGLYQIVVVSIAIICFIISSIEIHHYQQPNPTEAKPFDASDFNSVVRTFLILPGKINHVSAEIYPLIPWIGFCLCGQAAAYELIARPKKGHIRHFYNGIIFLTLFILLRFDSASGFFSYRGWPRNEGKNVSHLISFFSICPYPPSITFALLTLGINSILLYLFYSTYNWAKIITKNSRTEAHNTNQETTIKTGSCNGNYNQNKSYNKNHKNTILRMFIYFNLHVLMTFGSAPLIFYVLHFYLIEVLNVIIYTMQGSPHGASGFPMMYVIPLWFFLILPPLYPICSKYAQFKKSKSINSFWRLF